MTIWLRFTAFFGLFWIGGCALALVFQTRLLLHLPVSLNCLDGFVFGSTVFGYYCTHPRRGYRWLVWVLGGLGGLCFFGLDRTTQFLALGPALLWGLYYGLQRPGQGGLRRRPVAKPIVIALAWVWVTVWLPAQQWAWAHFVTRAAFIFALALAYDLTDLVYDQHYRLTTLVEKLGHRRAYLLIDSTLAVSMLCVAINFFQQKFSLAAAVAMWGSCLLTVFALRKIVGSTKSVFWKKAAIDALMVWQALAVWFLTAAEAAGTFSCKSSL